MKVLILANHFNYGGISAYILSLCKQWRGRKDLQIFVASRGGDLVPALKDIGVEHIRIPLKTKCEVSLKVFISFFKLFLFCKDKNFDLIHANTRVTQVLAALLSSALHVPYISTCHGFFKPRMSRRLIPCWGEKIVAISDQVRDHLMKDFGIDAKRIDLIYNGVDLERFAPLREQIIQEQKRRLGLDASKKTIGHIGRLSSVKGQYLLILAAEKLILKKRDIQLIIIGDGPERDNLLSLIKENGLSGIVSIKPAVDNTGLALSAMDVFVMPSLQEGLGISMLEAQAQGIPVAASRIGGIPTVIRDGETGLLFEPRNVEAMVASIERLLDDNELVSKITGNARRQVEEKFSAKLMAEKTLRVYEEFRCRKT